MAGRKEPTPVPSNAVKPDPPIGSPRRDRFAAAFTEWERRYREDPDAFMSAFDVRGTEMLTVGELSAAYFCQLLDELMELA